MTRVTKHMLTAIASIAGGMLIGLAISEASAQSRDLTGGEILQHYNTDGPAHDISKMYIAGVIDGMSVSGVICPPNDRRKADFVQQVVYNLGATEQLHERRFDIAVSSAAIMAYPCGDPA